MKNNEKSGTGNFQVVERRNESSENLIKRFLRKTKKEKIIEEILDRKRFKKETLKRREAAFKRKRVLNKLKELQDQENLISDLN